MEKVRILGIIIMALSALEFIPLIIYYYNYGEEYGFHDFMGKFKQEIYKLKLDSEKEERIIDAFEILFHYYNDNSGVSMLLHHAKSIAINIVIFGLIIAMLILQCPNNCKNSILGKTIASIILLVIAFSFAIIYDVYAFEVKYKLRLSDDETYIFNDKFNEEVKENVDYMYNRKIYLIVCVFLAQSAMIAQAVLIILKYRFTDKKQNVQMNFVQYPPYSSNAPINQENMQGIQKI